MPSKGTRKRAELRIVFDTSALYTNAAHFLLRKDVSEFITSNSDHHDIALKWYMPAVVLSERRYQMLEAANALLPAVEKLQVLLDQRLAPGRDTLKLRIEEITRLQLEQHAIEVLPINTGSVDWDAVIEAAVNRDAPFEPGPKEKGFRDAVVLETFLQLVDDSPATPSVCRVCLVAADTVLRNAARERTRDRSNVRLGRVFKCYSQIMMEAMVTIAR